MTCLKMTWVMLALAGCVTPLTASPPVTNPLPISSEAPGWFDVPPGWQPVAGGKRLVPSDGTADTWITFLGPMKYAGRQGNLSLEDWFSMMQEPGDIVKDTGIGREKDEQGREMLYQMLVLQDESPPCRLYLAVQNGDMAVMLILLGPSAESVLAHTATLDTILSSIRWDAAPS